MLLFDLLTLSPAAYRHACEGRGAPILIGGLVALTGLAYGFATSVAQRALLTELQGVPLDRIPDAVLVAGNAIAGIMIAVVVHLATTFVAWLMTRGVGGAANLVTLYRAGAYLLPFLALACPLGALVSVGGAAAVTEVGYGVAALGVGAVGVVVYLVGLGRVLVFTQATPPGRAALATVLFAGFCGTVVMIA